MCCSVNINNELCCHFAFLLLQPQPTEVPQPIKVPPCIYLSSQACCPWTFRERCHFLLYWLTWKAESLRCGQAAALHKGSVGVEGTSVTKGHSPLVGKYLLFGADLIPQSSRQEPRAHCPLHLWMLMRKIYLHMSNMFHLFVIPGSKLYQCRLLGDEPDK